ncbi:MAG: YARHG domain-containing protein [Cytophagaceae bacterium]
MKIRHLFPALIILLFSCKGSSDNTEKKASADTIKNQVPAVEAKLKRDPRTIGAAKSDAQRKIDEDIKKINMASNPLCGYWVGDFGKNKINITLAYIKDSIAEGHSVCAGNYREIKGSVKKISDTKYEFIMTEPGDDQYDGRFKFTIDLNEKNLKGNWAPFKNTVGVKTYILEKREFKYDPNVGDFAYASNTAMDESEVGNLMPDEAELMRNEIYARHGYSFQNLKMRRIFDAKDWYIPMGIDIRDQLTEVEAKNIDLLYNYEKYHEEYYDSYGR